MRRRTLTSPRLRKKKRKVVLRRSVLGVALAISLFLGARELLNADFFKIKSIEVIGAEKISSEEVKSIVSSVISRDQAWIFPRDNFLFVDASGINNLLQKTFLDFSKVRTTLAGVGNLVIEVAERAPYGRWCSLSGEKCLIIDNQGFAFDKNSDALGATLTVITEEEPILATSALNSKEFLEIKNILSYFSRFGFELISIEKKGDDYFIKTKTGFEIKITASDDLDSIMTKLISIKNELETEGGYSTIEYIDLRYGNKVFIRRR